MATPYQGIAKTSNVSDRAIREVLEDIWQPDAAETPMILLTGMVEQNVKPTGNTKFEDMLRDDRNRTAVVNGQHAADALTILCDDVSNIIQYDTLRTSTGEVLYVTNVNSSSNELTVVRAIGTTAAIIPNDDVLQVVGPARPEGDDRLEAVSYEPDWDYNYTQIFSKTVKASDTMINTDLYGVDWLIDQKSEKLKQLYEEMELSAIFGGRALRNTGGVLTRFSEGLVTKLIRTYTIAGNDSNVWDINGNITWDDFIASMDPLMTYGNSRNMKVILANSLMCQYLNRLGKDYITFQQTVPGGDSFGWNFTTFQTTLGTVKVKEHRRLTRMYTEEGVALVVDPDYIGKRYIRNRGPEPKLRIAALGTDLHDGFVAEYLCEIGWHWRAINAHGWWFGATGTA